jgi:hypothetical protein
MWGKRYFNFPGSQHERLCDGTGLQGPPETDIVAELTENARSSHRDHRQTDL